MQLRYFDILNTELQDHRFLHNMDRPSMADFCWFSTLQWLMDGRFCGISGEHFENFPNILSYFERMAKIVESNANVHNDNDDNHNWLIAP